MIENNSESNHGPSGDGNRMNMDETAARSTDTPNLFHVWEKKRASWNTFFGEESSSSQSESMKGDKWILDKEFFSSVVEKCSF